MTDEAPQPPPRNIGLWVGLGCLGVLVISCCLLTFWTQSYGPRLIANQNDATKIYISRVILVGALDATRKTCSEGVISEDTLPWFHPDMSPAARNRACELDEEILRALASPEQDAASPLVETGRQAIATDHGLDPSHCYAHSTTDIDVVGCFDFDGGVGRIPYRIIELNRSRPQEQPAPADTQR